MEYKNCYKTAESVSVGHPDSYMDYVVNSILDAYLTIDPDSRVAIDGVVKNKFITLGGEITSKAELSDEYIIELIKKATKEIGYTFEPEVTLHLYKQSPEIAMGTNDEVGGAGDQGTITGYACNTNESMVPLEKALADALIKDMYFHQRKVYNSTKGDYIRSDMKSQVTLHYLDNGEFEVDTVIFACQHSEDATEEDIRQIVIDSFLNVAENFNLTIGSIENTKYIVNGTGKFVIGGPEADSGEVGRKIVVDAYGVSVPVGGGTYNGKDATKVDRSAAYMARYVAKNIVAADLADECLITVSYVIGHADPVSVEYDFKGTEKVDKDKLIKVCNSLFSFKPADIINKLNLKKPIFATSGLMSHYGSLIKFGLTNDKVIVPWEETDMTEILIESVNHSH